MNRINLVCLGVRDMPRALEFYKAVGFQTFETNEDPPVVFFNNEGSRLELYPLSALQKDIDPKNPPLVSSESFSGMTLACNVKSKEEVDSVMESAIRAGGTLVKPPQTVFWGGYSGYFKDLDGYYWEVAYSDSWQFDDQNMLILDEG